MRDVDIARVDLDARSRRRPGALGGEQGRAGAGEAVEHDAAAPRAVEDRVGDQRDRLDRRVHRQGLVALRAEGC